MVENLKDLEGERYFVILNDGKPREIKFKFRALRLIDERIGLEKFIPVVNDNGEMINPAIDGKLYEQKRREQDRFNYSKLSNLQFMLWAGILHLWHGPDKMEEEIKEDAIAELIPVKNLSALSLNIYKAFVRDYFSTGETIEKKSEEQPPKLEEMGSLTGA